MNEQRREQAKPAEIGDRSGGGYTVYDRERGAGSSGRTGAPEECADRGCSGYAVCDPLGRKIGTAKEVFANGRGGPEYVEVGAGVLGWRSVLIPVQSVAMDHERRTLTLH